MCITAILAAVAVVAAAGGAAASISSANNNAAAAAYSAQLQDKQAKEQADAAQIQALQQENQRTAQYEQTRSSALAAIGASGIGDHISYFQGLEPTARDNYLRDVRSVRLNLTQEQSSIADGIQVNDYGATIAQSNASNSKVGAIAGFAQTAMQAGSFYLKNQAPTRKAA